MMMEKWKKSEIFFHIQKTMMGTMSERLNAYTIIMVIFKTIIRFYLCAIVVGKLCCFLPFHLLDESSIKSGLHTIYRNSRVPIFIEWFYWNQITSAMCIFDWCQTWNARQSITLIFSVKCCTKPNGICKTNKTTFKIGMKVSKFILDVCLKFSCRTSRQDNRFYIPCVSDASNSKYTRLDLLSIWPNVSR